MRRPAPGWWIIPGALLGVAMWLGLAFAALALVIDHDPGGGVNTRARLIERQEAVGERIQIRGYCASACTMHLHNSCIWPDAVLVFHGPSRRDPPLNTHDAARWSAVMARHYPPALAEWFMSTGRFGTWRMSGASAIALGAQACGEGD